MQHLVDILYTIKRKKSAKVALMRQLNDKKKTVDSLFSIFYIILYLSVISLCITKNRLIELFNPTSLLFINVNDTCV